VTADILSFLIGLGFSVSDAQAEAPVSQPKLESTAAGKPPCWPEQATTSASKRSWVLVGK
jgi:hypothetical protein